MDEITLTLNSPITEDQWDALTDVDFDNTEEIYFHTKHGKEVCFVKRRKGKWVKLYAGNYKCSECGAWWGNDDNKMVEDFKFCPNCGSYNGGES
jgi:DNA-directed RNA polymerase subunit RPC12/RpoP